MVNRVVEPVPAAAAVSTWKYGSNNVAAGVTPMSHESLLLVVAGCPVEKVSSGRGINALFVFANERSIANAEPAIRRVAAIAKIKSFLMFFSYKSSVQK